MHKISLLLLLMVVFVNCDRHTAIPLTVEAEKTTIYYLIRHAEKDKTNLDVVSNETTKPNKKFIIFENYL